MKFTVGSSDGEGFEELPAMHDVTLLLKPVRVLEPGDDNKLQSTKIVFDFEILDVEDEELEEHIGKTHSEWTNPPGGKTGKLSPKSNLYKMLEGLSGGTFDPEDEIDTEEYEGKRFLGDFKRRPRMKNIGTQDRPNFVENRDDNGNTLKKTVLENVRPVRERKRKKSEPRTEQAAEGNYKFDWDSEDN